MTDPATQSILALRRGHDELVALISDWGPEQLGAQSACAEWTVADTLSHLGSGSEFGQHTLATGKNDLTPEAVWDRWNAMSPAEQAAGFVAAGERQVSEFEAQDAEARANRTFDLGFLPMPVDVAFCADLRLSEMSLHRWDIEVPFDASATLKDYFVPIVLARLPLFAGFFAKPTGKTGRIAITTTNPDQEFVLEVTGEGVTLSEGADPGAPSTLQLPAEAFLRLVSGRLAPEHTPASVKSSGDFSLDELRRVFPGY